MGRELPKTLTRDEVDLLLARPNLAAPTGLRNRAMLELMVHAGLRVQEVTGIHLRDWRPKDHELHIRPEVGKGGREAYLPLDDQVEHYLERWKQIRRPYAAGDPHLFTTLRGTPVGPKYVWEMVERYARRAGVQKQHQTKCPKGCQSSHVHPHLLRHTFATELLRDGFDLREVQTLMRHADIRTTVIYTHVHDAHLAEKLRARRRGAHKT